MTTNEALLKDINEKLTDRYDDVVSWRRYMHQHPELSFKEVKTAEYIKEKLLSFGLEVKTILEGMVYWYFRRESIRKDYCLTSRLRCLANP